MDNLLYVLTEELDTRVNPDTCPECKDPVSNLRRLTTHNSPHVHGILTMMLHESYGVSHLGSVGPDVKITRLGYNHKPSMSSRMCSTLRNLGIIPCKEIWINTNHVTCYIFMELCKRKYGYGHSITNVTVDIHEDSIIELLELMS